jgi:hypothetical protein
MGRNFAPLLMDLFLYSYPQAGFRKFYGRHNDRICSFSLLLGHMLSDMFHTNR